MELESTISNFIQEEILSGDPATKLTSDTPLLNGIVDSAGLMQLVAFLEEEFDVELDEAEITEGNFRTVADIERLIAAKGAAG